MSAFLDSIPARLRPTIHSFCTDMWDGYLGAIETFMTNHADVTALIVVDRFHVAGQCRDGFETLRKQELRRLQRELPAATWREVGQGMMWILRHNHIHLDAERRQRLRRLFALSPQLHLAYTLREELTALFNAPLTLRRARQRLQHWMAKVTASSLTCYDTFVKTLRNHFEYIVNYFDRRANSGFVEGLNNKLKVLTRRCYGIRLLDTLIRRLRLDLGNYGTIRA